MASNKFLTYLLSVCIALLCLNAGKAFGADIPTTFSEPRVEFVDLTANRFSDQKVLVVTGNVKNIGDTTIQGYVIIYLMNGTSVINAIEAPVNKGAPIARGDKGYFELTTNTGNLPGHGKVAVEFVSQQVHIPKLR